MKTILQYYDAPRNIAISGMSRVMSKVYDPERVNSGEYDLVTSQAPNSPTYKAIIDDRLLEMAKNNLITMEMYLQHSTMPFAEQLLEDVKALKEQVEGGGTPNMGNMDIGADPTATQMLSQAVTPERKRLAQTN
jgi:hypothetical protein